MAPKRLPTRGGGKVSSAKDAPRADEATGAGGTGASGAGASTGGAAAARVTSPSRRIPGKMLPLWGLQKISFFFSISLFWCSDLASKEALGNYIPCKSPNFGFI
jgi:hypothetical protein